MDPVWHRRRSFFFILLQVRDLLTDLSPGLDDADRVLRVRQHPVSGPFAWAAKGTLVALN